MFLSNLTIFISFQSLLLFCLLFPFKQDNNWFDFASYLYSYFYFSSKQFVFKADLFFTIYTLKDFKNAKIKIRNIY